MASRFRQSLLGTLALAMLTVGAARGEESSPPPGFKHGQWPFTPLARPNVPQASDDGWCRSQVDRFIWDALAKQGLRPSPPADRLTLLRRVSVDLTGLPPTVDEQAAFLADSAPGAYERVVDRLLDSPAYGERWAQHWLDLVRYAESDGFKEDALRPAAFRYRDWVVRALNDDLPYDRFVSLQLAGDELEPGNPDALVATGFLRLYPDEYNAGNVRQRRQEILDEITDTTSLALLGLTMGCARCHDHKFDEVLQQDYFRLQAFFTPFLPRDDIPAATAEAVREHRARLAEWEQATADVRRRIEELLAPETARLTKEALEKFDALIRQAVETPRAERTAVQQQLAYQADKYIEPKLRSAAAALKGERKQQYDALQAELAQFQHLKPAPLPVAMAVSDAAGPPPPTFVLAAGNAEKPGNEVQPGFPAFLGGSTAEIAPPAGCPSSSGRRAALARWLMRRDHPLTARLLVNRLWQHHFGEGIVPTPNDFGNMGDAPSHPQLLDYLASELVDSGWRLKAIHKLLVSSAAYGQSSLYDPRSAAHAAARQADPENRLLWRARRQRLEGEALRDAMLAISGQLNRRMYGPSVRPELPAGLGVQNAWKADERPEERGRRSLYLLVKRNLRYPLFESFDQPDLHNSCPRRSRTTTAPQALALLNGEAALEAARHWAGRLLQRHGANEAALLQAACQAAWCRPASDAELSAARSFLASQTRQTEAAGPPGDAALPLAGSSDVQAARAAALVDFCHVLLNSNEFLYVD